MNPNIVAIVVAVLGGAGLGGLIGSAVAWRKATSEIEATEAGTLKVQIEALAETVKSLQAENTRLRERIDSLEHDRDADTEKISNLFFEVEEQRRRADLAERARNGLIEELEWKNPRLRRARDE